MAVRIRMTRLGRRDRACFRLGAYDSRTPRDGRCLQVLGRYEPEAGSKEKRLVLDAEGLKRWLALGALPTEKVAVLLKGQGLLEPKRKKRGKRKKKPGSQ